MRPAGTPSGSGSGGGNRGFCSGNSDPPPKQYLRYIHRAKPPEADTTPETGGNSPNSSQAASDGEGSRQKDGPQTPAAAADAGLGVVQTTPGLRTGAGAAGDGRGGVGGRGGAAGAHEGEYDNDEEDDGGLAAALGDEARTRDSTRRWLKGFKAEDILRDKTLLRQQLEVWFACCFACCVAFMLYAQSVGFLSAWFFLALDGLLSHRQQHVCARVQ